jgi:hypothetical protein
MFIRCKAHRGETELFCIIPHDSLVSVCAALLPDKPSIQDHIL